jgi:hypothetical protein
MNHVSTPILENSSISELENKLELIASNFRPNDVLLLTRQAENERLHHYNEQWSKLVADQREEITSS